MYKVALSLAMLFVLPSVAISNSYANQVSPAATEMKQQTAGSPVYIQIFKEERVLELYAMIGGEYKLVQSYPICKYSGGLGPKMTEGDFKSPEGFYQVDFKQLKPDSHYYRAINVGFPNEYDRAHGYSGRYLMIHGECVSIGCYAMTNKYIEEIYTYVEKALRNGQQKVELAIYPFRMNEQNMKRHSRSTYYKFWNQLQPGYAYFNKTHQPPAVSVLNGQYVVNQSEPGKQPASNYALAKTK
ncbi:murein L,D-transpeptidase [Dickeya dianthicola]|uniref:peptidoglycan meso-diaminopimelic acid protein amidase n=1 Tax=Dickeya dianthicola TaxID=204039 RepID=UPI00136B3571|nr:peptidoglycan meso-diaminopimelic acid protein amidase [Dickeya dianthicola]MBT1429262.1 murein L,D-transpeptidase [Dickeya dianthicola]MBT1460778.1 murein L,D-transpeptidase [Dickeya dianthicola]MBT1489973.1 murein L,D-transpeptidase [Dickeya dianthicola]MZI90544.1 murein L,D-transpeptidase [Dickeya dianthicola]